MQTVTETAFAKINLTLSVLARRPDGYHTIDSVMHSVSLSDTVTLSPAREISLSVEGPAPTGPENLMWKAAELFFKETGKKGGVSMTLTKRVPSEAGMGGGSSDAAAVLRGLSRMTETFLSAETLREMAVSLGADVPFCVTGGCVRCRGIGEILTPLPAMPGIPLLIVRPQVSVSTAAAYRDINRRNDIPPRMTESAAAALLEKNISKLSAALSNDFESALFSSVPELQKTKRILSESGLPVLMTGSGSAFFVFAGGKERAALKEKLRALRPDWFLAEAETVGEYGVNSKAAD